MADSPSPQTTIPMTLPDPVEEGGVRITRGTRQGWQRLDRSIIWDDGELEMALSGKSDAEKRAEALATALGTMPELQPGASLGAVDALRTAAAATADPEINVRRKEAAKAKAAAPEQEKRLPLSAEERQQGLRIEARRLIELEVARVEQLKDLAIGNSVTVGRDGQPATGNVPQKLHDAILAALSAGQRGDLGHTADALRELQRWTAIGGPQ